MSSTGASGASQDVSLRQIFALAIPALGALLAEPVFLLADSAIVGRLGPSQLAGVGIAAAILASVLWPFSFLTFTTTAAIARGKGSGTLAAALKTGVSGIWLGAILGSGLSLLLFLGGDETIRYFGGSPATTAHALDYLVSSLPGIPALLVMYACTGVLRGLQDTKSTLFVASLGTATNIVLNLVLVYSLNLGVVGSGLGTSITQWLMAITLIWITVRATAEHQASWIPTFTSLKRLSLNGTPLLLRTIAMRGSLLLTTAVAASLGTTETAAHHVVLMVWVSLALVIDSLAIAAQTLIGYALGAASAQSARQIVRRVMTLGLSLSAALGLGLLVFREPIARLFTTDANVQIAICEALVIAGIAQPVASIAFILDGVLIGAGDDVFLSWSSVAQFLGLAAVLGIASSTGLLSAYGLNAIWICLAGVHTGIRAFMLFLRIRGSSWVRLGVLPGT